MQSIRRGIFRVLKLVWTPISYVVVFIFIAIDVIASWIDWRFHTKLRKPKITVEEVEQLIETNLPPGSTSDYVFVFLEAHGIDHPKQIFDRVEVSSSFQNPKLNHKRHLIKGCIVAWKRNVGRDLITTWDIRILFYLDKQNSLVDYLVEMIGTGF